MLNLTIKGTRKNFFENHTSPAVAQKNKKNKFCGKLMEKKVKLLK